MTIVPTESNQSKAGQIDCKQKQRFDKEHTKQSNTTDRSEPFWWGQQKAPITIGQQAKKRQCKRYDDSVENGTSGKTLTTHTKIIEMFLLKSFKLTQLPLF